jgi:hypothetical protein
MNFKRSGSVLKFFYPQHFSIAPPIFLTVIIYNYNYLITRIKETLVTLSKLLQKNKHHQMIENSFVS